MKIIYVENVRIPSERAHAYQITQTCAWFARLGHDVTLVNPDRAGGKSAFEAYGLTRDLFRHVTLRVTDPLAWNWFRLKRIAYLWQRFSFSRALKRWAVRQTADVWYTRDPAMVDILRDRTRRFVLELHDRPDAQPERWGRIKGDVERFVVLTHGLKDVLLKLGIDAMKIHVAPDGYDPNEFAAPTERAPIRQLWNVPSNAFVAIYLGGFYPWKGVDLVVRAWAKTPKEMHLVLVGGPEADRRRLEGLISKEAASRVHVFDYLPHPQVPSWFRAADIGLLTSSPQFDIAKLYTSPLKQFEYLAAGLPILASDVPSSHEVLDERVAKFYREEDDFVRVLNEARDDVGWRERAAKDAQEIVKAYTWEARTQGIAAWLAMT